MRTPRVASLVSALLVACPLWVSCGGSDSPDQAGGSGGAMSHDGSAATGGSTVTGTGGSGGSTSAGGAANIGDGGGESAGAAGSSAAGSGGSTGTTADASTVDVAPTPGDCPMSVPADGTPCSGNQFCYIGQVQCGCYENIGLGWLCAGADSGAVANCPSEKPADGSPCPSDKGLSYCHYAMSACICGGRGNGSGRGDHWDCT